MADDELMDILEESDAESELTESGEEHGEGSDDEEGENQKVQGGEWPSSVHDSPDQQLDEGGFGGGVGCGVGSNAMLLKQEIFDQADPGWLDQHHPKGELGNHIQVKEEEEPARRRSRGN